MLETPSLDMKNDNSKRGNSAELSSEGTGEQAEASAGFFTRSPYAAIGLKAAGNVGAAAVTLAQVLTQFCVMVLFFLISGVNLNKLIPQRSSLFFSLICTASLTPLMLLRPGHVWGTAVFAIMASVILVLVVVFLCATDAPHDPFTPRPSVSFSTFGTAFGVILFGFGGHAILPALQATMLNPTPTRFRQAIIGSFAVCTVMYLSTSIGSVLVLGGTVGDDILTNFSGYTNDFGLVAVTCHLLFAAVTVHIPLGQIMDHYAGAADFSAKQIAIRTATMALVAASIWLIGDHFFCVIGLVGGTCNNAMIFIFPPWFYLRLVSPEERTYAMVAKMCAIMLIGSAGMASALVGAVDSCK
jgi:amino acid permease